MVYSLHFCTPSEISGQYIVKETKDAKKSSTGTVGLGVEWHVVKANIITCTCSYFKSSLMLYPCACVVASRAEDLNIDNPIHVHPYYWIVFRPMYLVALHTLRTADHRNAPWSKQLEALPATHNSSLLYQSKGSRNLYLDAYGLTSVKEIPNQESEVDITCQKPYMIYLDKTLIEVAQHQTFLCFECLDLLRQWRNPAETSSYTSAHDAK